MAKKRKGIFVSYRRGDTAGYAGRLTDRLDEHFGEQRVFHDVDSIDPGLDFVDAIQQALRSSEVLLAVIGKNWSTVTDESGQNRLQNPNDFVRMEIAAALQRDIRVIPVLVQGASMPRADELPSDLAPLARRNAFELHETSWGNDVRRLITTLEVAVGDRPQKEPPPRDREKVPTGDKKTGGLPTGAMQSTGPPKTSTVLWIWLAVVLVFIVAGVLLGMSGILVSP